MCGQQYKDRFLAVFALDLSATRPVSDSAKLPIAKVAVDRASREIVGSHTQALISITKNNGAQIGTQPFVDGSMPTISAALVSEFNAMAAADQNIIDPTVFPNLTTTNLFPQRALPIDEWTFEDKGPADGTVSC
jgi:hypothetical protein